jgi:signal transduction histidine kinase
VVLSLLLAGVLLAWAVVFLGVAGFFMRAWAHRREETEYLLFGLVSVSLAFYSASIAPFYFYVEDPGWPAIWRMGADVTAGSGIAAIALGLQFALRYSRSPNERVVMVPVYGAAAFYLLALVAGGWWVGDPDRLVMVPFLGGVVHSAIARPTPLAASFYALVVMGIGSIVVLLGRAWAMGKKEGLAAFVGSILLAGTVLNDAMVGAGKRLGVFLTPLGYVLFAFGVSLTLVTRYGRVSIELERRGSDLKKRTKELRRSYKALQKAQTELVRKEQLAVVGELAAVIAHEVRNPLAIIANAVAGLRRADLAPDDRATLLQIIEEETSRLNRLVSDLLCYARPVTPQRQLIKVTDLLDRSLSLAEGRPGVTVQMNVEDDAPPIWGDANLLRQVFDNLVGNAIQAMSSEGTLTVHVKPESQDSQFGALVEINDTGEGMDTQVRSRARTPFFTTRPSGTGLGLAIVDRIVDAHGGTMTLQSRPGEGTSVTVFLPRGHESSPPSRPRTTDPIGVSTTSIRRLS